VNTDGLLLRPSSHANFELWVDEIRLSNALTVEHNSLGMGAVGHIACARGCAPGAGGNGATGLVDTFYFYDHIGNVQGASDASGALASTTAQDAWGNVLSSLPTGAWASSFDGRGLAGRLHDTEVSLSHFHQRPLDPTLGRFLCGDRIRSVYGGARATYVDNHPTQLTDPSGLSAANLGAWQGAIDHCKKEDKNCKGDGGNCCKFVQCVLDTYELFGGRFMSTVPMPPMGGSPGPGNYPPGVVVGSSAEFGEQCMGGRASGQMATGGHIAVVDSSGNVCECTKTWGDVGPSKKKEETSSISCSEKSRLEKINDRPVLW